MQAHSPSWPAGVAQPRPGDDSHLVVGHKRRLLSADERGRENGDEHRDGRDDHEEHVDQKTPSPVGELGEHAAENQANGLAGAGDRSEDGKGLARSSWTE